MTSTDPVWMKALLATHIVCGGLSFLLAPVALLTAKGGTQHKRWGKVYLWSMGGVAATALPMAFYRPVLFLALVAIFSFYSAFSGYRAIRLKGLYRGEKPEPIDWIAAVLNLGCSIALVLLGWTRPDIMRMPPIVPAIFGGLGIRLSYIEIRKFIIKPKEKMFWWYTHLGNLIGSYIAAWSAFSVVTLSQYFGNTWLVWLWPTLIGAPAIALTVAYYKKKFSPKRTVQVPA